MQNVQISNDVAFLLRELTERGHISSANLIAQLVKSYKNEITKRDELKEFFEPYRKNISGFAFNREETNER
uniref:Ribbon-helix-helix protein CopG domain-containing protein n=1 Tax=Candidatus Kentrum sp. FW TaxID=2126338 RepID=A0A450TIA9_9GAMM|nr:MAG: hypothetical protein BECKFW1821B_GA0114236_112311 [Candidatus Kentron sp. FW]